MWECVEQPLDTDQRVAQTQGKRSLGATLGGRSSYAGDIRSPGEQKDGAIWLSKETLPCRSSGWRVLGCGEIPPATIL